jgi:hypothetical protein
MLLQGGGGDDMHGRFPVRSPRMDRGELMSSPAARQIYLTFPADSTFSEEDVSNYFRYRARTPPLLGGPVLFRPLSLLPPPILSLSLS